MNSNGLNDELSFAVQLAKDSGKIITNQFGLYTHANWKEDNTPVTQADLDVNKLVIERVKGAFPEDGILGEEASDKGVGNRLWVVDPIDGTQPYSLGVPLSTFCLALVVDGKPVVGVVYDPFMDRLYQACKGEGALLNDEKITISTTATLGQGYVVLSSRMGGDFATAGQTFDKITDQGGKAFNFRSMAYGCMMVASGTAVAALGGYFGPWDLAAPLVIMQEAGATVTDFLGNDSVYSKTDKGFVASNGKTHEQMLAAIKK